MSQIFQINCDSCHKDYQIASHNTLLRMYINHPQCNNIRTTCRHCKAQEVTYLLPVAVARYQKYMKPNIEVVPDATEEMQANATQSWASLTSTSAEEQSDHVSELPFYVLTPRLEQTAKQFESSLDAIPEDLFWEGMNSTQPSPYPARWAGEGLK